MENNIEYLPLGDEDDFDWQKRALSNSELQEIINNKQDKFERVGLNLYYENSNVGITLLAKNTKEIIIDLIMVILSDSQQPKTYARLLINHHGSLVHTYFLTDKAVFLTDAQNAFGCMVVSIITDVLMVVVCDGMGGLSRGEAASATVVQAFADSFIRDLPDMMIYMASVLSEVTLSAMKEVDKDQYPDTHDALKEAEIFNAFDCCVNYVEYDTADSKEIKIAAVQGENTKVIVDKFNSGMGFATSVKEVLIERSNYEGKKHIKERNNNYDKRVYRFM